MAAFSDFYDYLMPELPGIATAMLDVHIRDVAREFCQDTAVWRETPAGINTVANQAAYSIASSDYDTVRVTRVVLASVLLFDDQWHIETPGDIPKYQRTDLPFTLSADLNTITLIDDEKPTAAVTAGLVVTLAVKPTFAATTLPDFLKTEHMESIRKGVLSRLMIMAKKPWTDRELAMKYQTDFNSAKAFAAYNAQVGNTKQRIHVRKWG